jgi:magnesium transporter
VTRHLIVGDRVSDDASDEAIAERLRSPEVFWLDIHAMEPADITLMRDVFGFHPLAVEDVEDFGQRAKVEEYDGFTYLVAFGAAPPNDDDRLVEVHIFYSEHYLVTVHRDEAPAIDETGRRCDVRPELLDDAPSLLYHVLDSLVDGFFPVMDDIDARIASIETRLEDSPDPHVTAEIFGMRRELVTIRRAIAPQRDQMARIASGSVDLPGLTPDTRRYFRDVEDHLIRISGIIDGYRDLLAGATDVYLSQVNNRLNLVMKQLTAIAGIFLPLTFITGFFGQNFAWMVEHVGGPGVFFVLGIVLQVTVAAGLVIGFRRAGWL